MLIIPFLGILSSDIFAQDILVTADRIRPANAVSTRSVEREYSGNGEQDLSRVLQSALGQSLATSGGAGTKASVFMRGTESYHTQVVVDGILMNDPSTPNRAYDLGHLGAMGISRVDIAKGPQSVLYGGDALGGVINITTAIPEEGRTEQKVVLGAGSYGKHQLAYDFATNDGFSSYALAIESRGEKGYDTSGGQGDLDGRKYLMGRGKASQRWGKATFGINAHGFRDKVDLDNGPSPFPGVSSDDPNHSLDSQEIATRAYVSMHPINFNEWESTLSYAYLQHDRKQENPTDELHSGPFDSMKSAYRGKSHQARWENQTSFEFLGGEAHLLGGISFNQELSQDRLQEGRPWGKANTASAHLQAAQRWEIVEFVIGGRRDRHSLFGGVNNAKGEILLYGNADKTVVKAGANTGSKFPSLFQLTDSNFGNPNLQPERAVSYEADLLQKLGTRGRIQVSAFITQLNDRFNYDPLTFKSTNQGKAKIQGVEFSPEIQLSKDISARGSYSNILARSKEDGSRLLRRPRDGMSLGLNYKRGDQLALFADWGRKGKRDDVGGTMPAQSVTDIGAAYRLTRDWDLAIQVRNLFDRDYQDVLGYEAPGRSYFATVVWKL